MAINVNINVSPLGAAVLSQANPAVVSWIRVETTGAITLRTAAETLSDLGAQAAGTYLVPADIGVTVQGYNANTTILGNSTTGSGSIVLATSPTIATSLILDYGTASTVVYLNASKQLISLANGTGVLTNNGSGTLTWAAVSGGAALSAITAATGTNTINNVNHAQVWGWNSLTTEIGHTFSSSSISSGSVLKVITTSTAATGNTQKAFEIAVSGANATASQTTYGAYIVNAHSHSGNDNNNVGLYTAATGTGNNFALRAYGMMQLSGEFRTGYDTPNDFTSQYRLRIYYDGGNNNYYQGINVDHTFIGNNWIFGVPGGSTERFRIVNNTGNIYIGNGVKNAAATAGSLNFTGGSGSNNASAIGVIQMGLSTGNSTAGGYLSIKGTPTVAASGSTVQTGAEVARFTKAGDLVLGITSDTKGFVLKSPDGNYWRITIDNAGVLAQTSLGTSIPN